MLSKQLIAKRIGASGCYFLSLVYHAEKISGKQIDVIALYDKAVSSGWCTSDCYMQKPADMISYVIGKKPKSVSVRHEPLDYQPKADEYEITRYESRAGGTTHVHFVVTRDRAVIYDPYGKSATVKNGKPVSKRIIKVAA